MSRKDDWVAQTHKSLYEQAIITVDYLTAANLARMGIAGGAAVWITTVFTGKYNTFKVAYLAWENPAERTPVKIAALQVAEKAFITEYRRLYMGYLKNNPLTADEDLVGMAMPRRRSGGKTAVSAPATTVTATVDSSLPGIVGICYRDRYAPGKARPEGMTGVEIIWQVFDTEVRPADRSELVHSEFSTRSPRQFAFGEKQRGKRFAFALRWRNTRGINGPWSDIMWTIIP
ncbi:MAG: hypothetical protein LBJ01_05405 [Tannerella sp.]|jgi:hypothetical protein|nr:hypothetical protein [Tannerella sp.]